ncbi:glycosyltransferase family 4 protein [Pediococcus siamensis]|uniref:glycosyltransferase family 4 protein n=1 Tax=Pediococcus siamensis TaxID=381829 RepID=UPI00399F490C
MFSSASKVKGQGVESAYEELISLLKTHFPDEFEVRINQYSRAEISHYHTIDPQFYLSTFMPGRGRKIGYVHFLPETIEGSLKIPQPFRSIFYKYIIAFYKRMDHIVVVNPTFIPKLAAYGIPEDKVSYIPNFVHKSEFYEMTDEKKQQVRQQLGIPSQKFMILGIGQVQERKGVKDFIKLAQHNPNVQFVWAGGFSFGRMTDGYTELKKVVDNPPANLRFTGIVDRSELVNYYNAADLFLLPSYNELFPMSVLEAFSCGTPVLLRDLDLYHAIIAGDYAPAADVSEMQQQIERLLNDPSALKQLHRKSIEASEKYSEAHLANIWHGFYMRQAREG